jgi:hypothetical protein
MILTVTVIDSTGITLSGDQTEISVVNPATSVTYNPVAPFTATDVQNALPQAHKMIGEQSNNYSVTLDYGNEFEISNGSDFARLNALGSFSGFFANLESSDKIAFITDGNLNALLNNSGSTFYDKLEAEGSGSIVDGIIQTNNTSGNTRHHLQMRNSGSSKGFLGTTSSQVFLGRASGSVSFDFTFFGGSFSPSNQYGDTKDGVINLGKTNSRFKDLYLSDNLYADGVSFEDANITFTTDQFTVDNASNNNLISTTSQSVNLKYDGIQRLATTNSGVSITGSLDATTGNISNLNTSGTVSAGNVVVSGSVSVDGTVDGRDLSVDGGKLDNIESNATADQTDAEIRAAVDAATDSNVYTDAEKTKLTSIETGATADQTDAEIRSAVASATDSNVFTDSEKTKLSGAAELDSSPTFTGTVSSTGLAVDTDTLYVDEANDRVGINTSSPDYNLVVADTGTSTVQIKAGNANYSQLNFGDTDDNDIGQIAYIHDSNEMRFTSNNSQAMVIDSSGKVGIGTSSPSHQLLVQRSDDTLGNAVIGFQPQYESGGGSYIRWGGSSVAGGILRFLGVNNNERMRIDSSGRVGIGTTSPSSPLTVATSTSSWTTHLYNNAPSGSKSGLLLDAGSTVSDYAMYVRNAATNADFFTIRGDGNVGIGTTSPAAKLHVQSGSEAIRVNTANENTYMSFGGTRAMFGYARIDATDVTCIQGSTGKGIVFCTDNSAFGSGEKARITASGNVGIGTDSPAQKTHLSGAGTQYLRVENTLNSVVTDFGTTSTGSTIINRSAHPMSFFTNSTERMRIDSVGNVGIGTTSPDQKLEVDGGIKVTNNFTGETSANSGYFDFVPATSTARITTKGTDGSTLGKFEILQQASDGSPNATPFTIDANSNVGIGTTSPDVKLDVTEAYDTVANVLSNGSYAAKFSSSGSGNAGRAQGILLSGQNGNIRGVALLAEAKNTGNAHDFVIATSAATSTPTERMRITSSGNVGIGTTTVGQFASTNVGLTVDSGNDYSGIAVTDGSTTSTLAQGFSTTYLYNQANGSMLFGTNNTERMRITSSGNVLIGTTDVSLFNNNSSGANSNGALITASGEMQVARYGGTCLYLNRMADDGSALNFYNRGALEGYINTTQSGVSLVSVSDQRLKENITDSGDAGSTIDSIQVRQFDWIANGKHEDYGFVAQELANAVPDVVYTGEDEDETMGVDYSKLVPMLIKEIQTLRNRVAQLENN